MKRIALAALLFASLPGRAHDFPVSPAPVDGIARLGGTHGPAAPSLAKGEAPPPLRTGDLVFQTSRSGQSGAILAATKSPYTHVGMVVEREGRLYVVEAAGPVAFTPLERFVARGKGRRITVLRPRDLDDATRARLASASERYLGRPYDPLFLDGEERLYCSELVWVVYRDIGRELQGFRTLGELDLDAKAVRALLAKRWRRHPACSKERSLAGCVERVKAQRLLPPGDLAKDPSLELVYSSYPEVAAKARADEAAKARADEDDEDRASASGAVTKP